MPVACRRHESGQSILGYHIDVCSNTNQVSNDFQPPPAGCKLQGAFTEQVFSPADLTQPDKLSNDSDLTPVDRLKKGLVVDHSSGLDKLIEDIDMSALCRPSHHADVEMGSHMDIRTNSNQFSNRLQMASQCSQDKCSSTVRIHRINIDSSLDKFSDNSCPAVLSCEMKRTCPRNAPTESASRISDAPQVGRPLLARRIFAGSTLVARRAGV